MIGFSTLRELISKSPAKSNCWLQLLLELTTAEKEQVGDQTKIFVLNYFMIFDEIRYKSVIKTYNQPIERKYF